LLPPVQIDLSKAPLDLSKSIVKITAIIEDDAENFHGTTIQQAIQQDKIITLRNVLLANSSPDYSLSDADLKKKYQIDPRPTPQLIPGAIPGVNCGIGTNVSCCCAGNSTGVNSFASQSAPVITNDGVYRVGGRVSAPVVLNTVEAEFSDEARRAKYQGICQISVIVDAQGKPQNLRIVRGLGMGLDEKALDAIRMYKFKPAMLDGKTPVPVTVDIDVNFKLY
jgi:TonB family protein